jgi:hypothetical protein
MTAPFDAAICPRMKPRGVLGAAKVPRVGAASLWTMFRMLPQEVIPHAGQSRKADQGQKSVPAV